VQTKFPPYRAFRRAARQIDEFADLADLSFGIAQQLLFKHPRDTLPELVVPSLAGDRLSFSMADQEVASVDLKCGWIPLGEYAEKLSVSVDEIVAKVAAGELGPTASHPTTGAQLVIWPPEEQTRPLEQLPQPGLNAYTVTLKATARAPVDVDLHDLSAFEQNQAQFLRLAHALGEPAKVAERVSEVLNRSALLLYWTAFEVFLRSTIHELLRRHPHKLGRGKRGKESITYEDVVVLSSGLTSVEQLRESLVQREIERSEDGGQSVHGLINFLKAEFGFKNDPYKGWYVHKGKRYETAYSDLHQLKEARNALVHQSGDVTPLFAQENPSVPIRKKVVVIDDEFYLRSVLLLHTVAYRIASSIDEEEYQAY
jgi:hypothetical protein